MAVRAISLFTGAGGMDIGVAAAGFRIALATDMDPYCIETLRANMGEETVILEGRIEDIPTETFLEASGLRRGEVDLIFGGPPCQPYSKSAHWTMREGGLSDPRSRTLLEFLRVVQEAQPRAFLLENVYGLAYKKYRHILDSFVLGAEKAGYAVRWKVLNAADYGVPQIRERLFVIGIRGTTPVFPEPTHSPGGDLLREPYVTAGQALEGLSVPEEELPELEVRGRWEKELRAIPPGQNYLYLTAHKGHPNPVFRWRQKYWSFLLKLSPDKPSWTIQAQPGPWVGPFHWDSRRLAVGEMKRLMTFPDDYVLVGPRREVQRQLGNAVPPLLAYHLASSILEQLGLGSDESTENQKQRDVLFRVAERKEPADSKSVG